MMLNNFTSKLLRGAQNATKMVRPQMALNQPQNAMRMLQAAKKPFSLVQNELE